MALRRVWGLVSRLGVGRGLGGGGAGGRRLSLVGVEVCGQGVGCGGSVFGTSLAVVCLDRSVEEGGALPRIGLWTGMWWGGGVGGGSLWAWLGCGGGGSVFGTSLAVVCLDRAVESDGA